MFKMICGVEIIFLIAAIFSLNFELCFCSCARTEYEIDGQCCPMCTPGYRVYKHCTVETSTTCVSCHDSTFIDAPNGLIDCFSCTVCDSGQGLRVKIPCTQSSDTVCEQHHVYVTNDLFCFETNYMQDKDLDQPLGVITVHWKSFTAAEIFILISLITQS
uniref:TNFR-Cys domain-containing protein n=1 Tax=Pygocentrus nattereri TaxID=42514 RepID=A0AAR2IH57_PYGNA